MFEYYTIADSEQIRFYQLPKELVKHKQFKRLSDSAKILYALLRDRVSLSVKNNWIDELGRVYIIFTLTEIMEDLGCADQKATKSMKELQKIGLVESVRRGLGKPNIIYVKNFATGIEKNLETPINPQTRDFHDSGFVKITSQESLKSRIKIRENHEQSILNLNNTEFMDTESKSKSDQAVELSTDNTDRTMTMTVDSGNVREENILQKEKELSQPATPTIASGLQSPLKSNPSSTDDYTMYNHLIQDNIHYSHYLHNRQTEIELVDELISCMLDVICTQGDTVKINGEKKSRNMVKSQYLKINQLDIDHILDRYKEQHHKITHLHSYLKTMLYTIKQESGHYYTNAVRTDGLVW